MGKAKQRHKRKRRRIDKAVLKHGPSAKRRHAGLSGRRGMMRLKILQSIADGLRRSGKES